MTREELLTLFCGDQNLVDLRALLAELSHTWDDIVDGDKPVGEEAINRAFGICLISLPQNPLYRAIQGAVLPMWVTVISAYQAGNRLEREKEAHGIEISHSLRYAAGHIFAYAIHVALGEERAAAIMPIVWKDIVAERFDDYKTEHLC